jgi:hypothetical protein
MIWTGVFKEEVVYEQSPIQSSRDFNSFEF